MPKAKQLSITPGAIKVRKWRLKYPERYKASAEKYRKNHREICKARCKSWYARNSERSKKETRAWMLSHPEQHKANKRALHQKNKHIPAYRIEKTLRSRLYNALKHRLGLKAKKTMALLGCPIADFVIYLESKFQPGMTWDNYGKGLDRWHVDHIIPCALFDMTRPEHQKICFHFSNQQPLWAIDNMRKQAKLDYEIIPKCSILNGAK